MDGCYAVKSMAACQRLGCRAAGRAFPPLRPVRAARDMPPLTRFALSHLIVRSLQATA